MQPCQLAVQQCAVGEGVVDEQRAFSVPVVQVVLIDFLIRAAAGGSVRAHWRIAVALYGIHGDGFGALNDQPGTRINGDVAIGRRILALAAIGGGGSTIAAQTRRIELQSAPRPTIVLPGCGGSTVTQVDTRTTQQREGAIAGAEFDDCTVGRIDDLAIAVDPQHAAMGVEHRVVGQRQAVLARQTDAADPLAAGVDGAVYRQAAVIQRNADVASLYITADVQVALFELEAARAVHLALIKALVERGKLTIQRAALTETLSADIHTTRHIRHQSAPGVVITAAAAEDLPLQIHQTTRSIQRHNLERTSLIVYRPQINHRACRLTDVTGAALQRRIATPAVFGDIIEADLAPGHVDPCGVGEGQIVFGRKGQFATRQGDQRVKQDALTRHCQLCAQRPGAQARITDR